MKKTKQIISICKRCSLIKLFEVGLDFCIEDEKEKLKNDNSSNILVSVSTSFSSVFTYTTVAQPIVYSGMWNPNTSSIIVSPLTCADCSAECDICFLEPNATAGRMDKCDTCDNRFLCITNRLEPIKYCR
jgi:hypothetical protein